MDSSYSSEQLSDDLRNVGIAANLVAWLHSPKGSLKTAKSAWKDCGGEGIGLGWNPPRVEGVYDSAACACVRVHACVRARARARILLCERAYMCAYACVTFVCTCARARECMCVCVCVRARACHVRAYARACDVLRS